jgi:hypothetical protein
VFDGAKRKLTCLAVVGTGLGGVILSGCGQAREAASAKPVVVAPPPTVPVPPTAARRVDPTSAQVQAAIAQLHQRIPTFQPTEAQAREFASRVCTAFDQGQTYDQIRAATTQAVAAVQWIKVSPADVDFAIRTAVQLACPGYLSRLP